MSWGTCSVHLWTHENCAGCLEARTRPPQRPWLSGRERTYLESLRDTLPIGLANREERPIAADLDPDGIVRFRPATLADQLDRIVAYWLFEQGYGDSEEVA